MGDVGSFAWLSLQSAAYYSAICWLCWWYWRQSGVDFLLLPTIWLIIIFITNLAAPSETWLIVALLSGCAAASGGMLAVVRRRGLQAESSSRLIPALVVTLIAVMAFEVATDHMPVFVTVSLGARQTTLIIAATAFVAAIAWQDASGEMTRLRLGVEHARFEQYWSLVRVHHSIPTLVGLAAAWFICVGTPLTTTGALAAGLFRDALFGILAARLVDARSGATLVLIGTAVGIGRTAVGVAVQTSTIIALMDAALLAILFLFVGKNLRQHRWQLAPSD